MGVAGISPTRPYVPRRRPRRPVSRRVYRVEWTTPVFPGDTERRGRKEMSDLRTDTTTTVVVPSTPEKKVLRKDLTRFLLTLEGIGPTRD